MAPQFVFGLLSARCTGRARAVWNLLLREQGIDGFFDFYPTSGERELTLRLAEMFHLDRRAYVLSGPLQDIVRPLLDRMDSSVTDEKAVDTIINTGGVLVGFHIGDLPPTQQLHYWLHHSF